MGFSYGTKGAAIITHTLLGLFPAVKVLIDVLRPLRSHVQLLTYMMVPYCAARLIAEDQGLPSIEEGYSCMLASSDVGELINPERDEDEELDEIYRQNIMSFTRQGKQRSGAFTVTSDTAAGSGSGAATGAPSATEVSIPSIISIMIISCSLCIGHLISPETTHLHPQTQEFRAELLVYRSTSDCHREEYGFFLIVLLIVQRANRER